MGEAVALAGEVWSPNLGDPLIHACLDHLLRRPGRITCIHAIDFEERTGYPAGLASRHRQLPPLLRTIAWRLLRHPARQRLWSRRLAGCQALFIGGGQLLDDRGMLFPLRLAALAQAARHRRLPVALLACGAAESWSSLGRHLVERPFARVLRSVLVRDRASARHLARTFPAWPPALVAPDPAVWAGTLYGVHAPRSEGAPVGLGIAGLPGLDAAAACAWWGDLANQLGADGLACQLFSNGSEEDEQLLDRVAAATGAGRAPRPRHPRALVETIAGYRAVASARLHAGIIGFSLGVPAVCVLSAGKAAGFWEQVGLPDRAMGPAAAELVACRLAGLARGPGDPPGLLPAACAQIAEAVAQTAAATVESAP